jgi:hypothetical protein
MTRLLHGLMALLIGIGFWLPSPCTAQTRYVPGEDSRVWIEGTSTVRDFTCSTQQIEGHVRLDLQEASPAHPEPAPADTMRIRSAASGTPDVQARVPVRALDCGKRRQNKDLYEAMKASDHPAIHYDIIKARIVAPPDSTQDHHVIEAIGNLTVAGETRTVRITLEGRRLENGRIHARGSLPMQMTNFDVEPPTAMLGLIRVRDEITVHFDITAAPAAQP